jgi:hypothetical protein
LLVLGAQLLDGGGQLSHLPLELGHQGQQFFPAQQVRVLGGTHVQDFSPSWWQPQGPLIAYGRYTDNLFIERLWRSLKYEEVYLKAYADGREARVGIGAYLDFYNTQRPHQALGYRTPAEVFLLSREASRPAGLVESPGSQPPTGGDQGAVGLALNKASNLSK